jgi:hypothetical protein
MIPCISAQRLHHRNTIVQAHCQMYVLILWHSVLWHGVIWYLHTDVLEEHAAFISRLRWSWRQYIPSNRWYPVTRLHGVTIHKTTIWIFHSRENVTSYIDVYFTYKLTFIAAVFLVHKCWHLFYKGDKFYTRACIILFSLKHAFLRTTEVHTEVA